MFLEAFWFCKLMKILKHKAIYDANSLVLQRSIEIALNWQSAVQFTSNPIWIQKSHNAWNDDSSTKSLTRSSC